MGNRALRVAKIADITTKFCFLLLSAGILAGCAMHTQPDSSAQVQLEDLGPYDPKNYPERENWFRGTNADSYRVQPGDIIEFYADQFFTLHSDDADLHQASRRAATLVGPLVSDDPSDRLKFILQDKREIVVDRCIKDTAYCVPVFNRTIKEIQQFIADATHKEIRVSIFPQEPARAFPGDEVVITLSAMITPPDNSRTGYNITDEFTGRVNHNGFLFVPSITHHTELTEDQLMAPKSGLTMRDWHASIGVVQSRARLWDRGWTYEQMPTLTDAGRCMSIFNEGGSDAIGCRQIAFGPELRPRTIEYQLVRYSLTPGYRDWHMIDENGRRHVEEYTYGNSVLDAAVKFHRAAMGREINGGVTVYLTVVPRDEMNSPPFCAKIDPNTIKTSRLNSVLLLSQDTVIISRRPPERIDGGKITQLCQ